MSAIHLRLICLEPLPSEYQGSLALFGLQDNEREIHPGTKRADGSVCYEIEVPVKRDADSGQPRFYGPFAHGTPRERFLYLTWQREEGGSWSIIRRLKIHLSSITWEQIEELAGSEGGMLEASVSGEGSASVPLLGDGWTMRQE